jgi:hypothetical protein
MNTLLIIATVILSQQRPETQKIDSDALIKAMKKGALHFENCQATYFREWHFEKPDTEVDPERVNSFRRADVQATWQGEMYYCKLVETTVNQLGKRKTYTSEFAYDGKQTLANDKDQIGNVRDNRMPVYPWIPPHLAGCPGFGDVTPADLAEFNPKARATPRLQQIDATRLTNIAFEEQQGLRCARFDIHLRKIDTIEPVLYLRVWASVERNYIPVRSEMIVAGETIQEAEVLEWFELLPGLWTPKRAQTKTFRSGKLTSTGVIEISRAAVGEEQDLSHFQNVRMPTKGPIYYIENGKIVAEVDPGDTQER